MHPEDIKAEIRKKSCTQRAIAAKLSITSMAVSHIIEGRQKSGRVAREISKVTGIPVAQLWPGKYPELTIISSLKLNPSTAAAELAALRKSAAPKKARAA
jgi:lambda repressor-like predicted transcriptional regulator